MLNTLPVKCEAKKRGMRERREEELFAGAAAWPSQQSQQSLSLLDISALCCALSAGEMNRKRPHTATDRQTHTHSETGHIDRATLSPAGGMRSLCA